MLHVSDHPQLSNMFGMVFRVNLDWIYLVISSTFDFKLVLIVIISKRKEDGYRCGNVRIMLICQIICVKKSLDEIIPFSYSSDIWFANWRSSTHINDCTLKATRGAAGSPKRRIPNRFLFHNHAIDWKWHLFSGDLSPQTPEYDELMADLTEDELKAAFRLEFHFFNSECIQTRLCFILTKIMICNPRLFDVNGEGFIRVETFRVGRIYFH